MKIDYKKLLNMFKDKYDEISHFNKHDYEIYKEYLYQFDKLIDDEIEFAKLAHKFEDSVNDAFSDRYCLALMFALEELGLLDAIESGRIEESINGDCYIYYDDDDGERLVFCDYVKGITDTRDWFYLNEYIIDAIHIFKNEKQAQKFIDEHLKYFADQDKVVIAEYPQTVSGFFESKESARKSIKESKIMSYKDFQDVCMEESENDIINFHEYKGAYFVILRTEEECERLLRVLCDKYRFEGTCYKIIDPYNPNYKCYEIMCV